MKEGFVHDYYEDCKNCLSFDVERHLLVCFLWNFAKRDTGFDLKLLLDTDLYKFEDQKKSDCLPRYNLPKEEEDCTHRF